MKTLDFEPFRFRKKKNLSLFIPPFSLMPCTSSEPNKYIPYLSAAPPLRRLFEEFHKTWKNAIKQF